MKIVEVRWEDAHSVHERTMDLSEAQAEVGKAVFCHTVGFLVAKTSECVVVAAEQSEDGFFRDVIRIPRSMVRRMRILR